MLDKREEKTICLRCDEYDGRLDISRSHAAGGVVRGEPDEECDKLTS